MATTPDSTGTTEAGEAAADGTTDGVATVAVDAPAAAQAGLDLTERVAAEPSLTDVVSYWSLQAPPLRNESGDRALVLGRIEGSEDEVRDRIDELAPELEGEFQGLDVAVTGQAQVFAEVGETIEHDLLRAEMIAIPVTLVLLLFIFRGVIAALLPLAVGALSVVSTFVVLESINRMTEVSVFALNLTTAMGLGSTALTLIAGITVVLLFLMFGSVVVPIKALILNVLSLTATFGAMVWIFQEGNWSGFLDFTAVGSTDATTPVLMFCIAFGLSMDYEVFLLSRIEEEFDRTGDNRRAVAVGLERTGRILTAAALLLAMIFVAFATSEVRFIKLFGLGLALAVLIDAFVIRGTLVPAFITLADRANWLAPGPLRRFHDRFGIHEHVSLDDPGHDGPGGEETQVVDHDGERGPDRIDDVQSIDLTDRPDDRPLVDVDGDG